MNTIYPISSIRYAGQELVVGGTSLVVGLALASISTLTLGQLNPALNKSAERLLHRGGTFPMRIIKYFLCDEIDCYINEPTLYKNLHDYFEFDYLGVDSYATRRNITNLDKFREFFSKKIDHEYEIDLHIARRSHLLGLIALPLAQVADTVTAIFWTTLLLFSTPFDSEPREKLHQIWCNSPPFSGILNIPYTLFRHSSGIFYPLAFCYGRSVIFDPQLCSRREAVVKYDEPNDIPAVDDHMSCSFEAAKLIQSEIFIVPHDQYLQDKKFNTLSKNHCFCHDTSPLMGRLKALMGIPKEGLIGAISLIVAPILVLLSASTLGQLDPILNAATVQVLYQFGRTPTQMLFSALRVIDPKTPTRRENGFLHARAIDWINRSAAEQQSGYQKRLFHLLGCVVLPVSQLCDTPIAIYRLARSLFKRQVIEGRDVLLSGAFNFTMIPFDLFIEATRTLNPSAFPVETGKDPVWLRFQELLTPTESKA